jgi:hypothetical protein
VSPEALERFSNRLPSRIEDALDLPVVREVVLVAGQTSVQAFIHFELIKLSNLISVGGNLNHQQAVFIAQELISLFPNETLADFKLCFQRGAIGQYGEIYRMDGIVIRGWMEKYLEEKYEVKVREMYKERDQLYQRIKNTEPEVENQDKHQEWLDKLKAAVDGIEAKKVPSLPDEMINELGKKDYKRPSATRGYAWFDVGGVKIYATSQEHAEELVALHIKNGDIEEV